VAPDETYTHGHHESVLRSHTWRTVENSAAYLIPYLRSGLDLLDIGCGPGTITADFAQRLHPGRVTGLDRAADVVERARSQHAPNLEFRTGDVYALDFHDDVFDIVHAHQVLQHLAEPVAALREMRRVCRPGGVIAVRDSDYASFSWAPADPVLDEWLALYRRLARANGGEPDAGRYLLGWAHAAGLDNARASASAWCFATAEDRAWWGSLWADRMRYSSIAEQAIAAGTSPEALDEMAAAFMAWSEHPDGWFAVLHGEILAIT